jgi:hypothetical protein
MQNNSIQISIIEKSSTKVSAKFDIQGEWSKYFTQETPWIDYGVDVSDVPDSVLIIAFVANILPMVWLMNAELITETLDADFLADIDKAKSGYEKMFPMFKFSGKITTCVQKNIPTKQIHKSAAFFSGGVDAWTTLMRHIDEKPVLLTIWGADIKWEDEKSWQNVNEANKKTASDFDLPYSVIRSNFRRVIKEGELSMFVKDSGDAWWHGFQHGIALIAHAAPLAYLYGLKSLYIASSYPETMAGMYTCASDPTIDNFVNFCGCKTIHDGREYDRLDKVRYLMSQKDEYTSKMQLRVCWQANSSGKNCCKCEKCYRTILELVSVNCPGGVGRYGFNWHDDDIKRMEHDFKSSITLAQFNTDQFYPPVQQELRKNKDLIPDFEKYQWILDMDFSKFNDYPIKTIRKIKNKVFAFGAKIKCRLKGKK